MWPGGLYLAIAANSWHLPLWAVGDALYSLGAWYLLVLAAALALRLLWWLTTGFPLQVLKAEARAWRKLLRGASDVD